MGYRGASAELAAQNTAIPDPAGSGASGGAPAPQDGLSPEVRNLIYETANALQVHPRELATILSYETGGTMDPMQPGPTTKWGQHRGLIQFGEPQAKQYGVDFSSPEAALKSQLGKDGAIVKYALGSGFKPGEHKGVNLYATINAGNPNALGAKDAAAGGAPGTVEDKYYEQMRPHAEKFAHYGMDYDWGGGNDTRGKPPTEEAMDPKMAALKEIGDGLAGGGGRSAPVETINDAPVTKVQLMAIPEF